MSEIDLIPIGCVTARVLMSLANKLRKLEYWHKHNGGAKLEPPSLRLIQCSKQGKVTALVQSGNLTLKLALRYNASHTGEEDWVVLGDALKISD